MRNEELGVRSDSGGATNYKAPQLYKVIIVLISASNMIASFATIRVKRVIKGYMISLIYYIGALWAK